MNIFNHRFYSNVGCTNLVSSSNIRWRQQGWQCLSMWMSVDLVMIMKHRTRLPLTHTSQGQTDQQVSYPCGTHWAAGAASEITAAQICTVLQDGDRSFKPRQSPTSEHFPQRNIRPIRRGRQHLKKHESGWWLWYAELRNSLRPFLLSVQPLGQECARVMGLAMWANDGRPTGGANYLSLRIGACAIMLTCDERRRRRQPASLLKLEWQTSKSSPN